MLPFILLALVALHLISAAPTLVHPLQDQFPPVARVGRLFVFDLLPSTFTSSESITLTSSALPGWLKFDPGARTFSGTPTTSDLGQRDITVTATDSTGAATNTWRVIVTNFLSPEVHSGFTTQIGNPSLRAFSSVTPLPNNTGVQVPPTWSFSLGWEADTFRLSRNGSTNGQLFMAARLRYTSSLPSWLIFNNETMTFTGVAPAMGSYPVVVTGTDFWGYTAAQTSFVLQVGDSRALELLGLTLGKTTSVARGRVQATISFANVTFGGAMPQAGQVKAAVDGTAYPWLSIDR
jgi:axial budding pattern protein 2